MRISFKAFASVFAAAIMMSSCTSSDNEPVTVNSNIGRCMTYIQDNNSKNEQYSTLTFGAEFNYTDYTVDLTISGLVLPTGATGGDAYPSMVLKKLPWKFNKEGWRVINVKNVTPEITGMSVVPVFTEFNLLAADMFSDDGDYTPAFIYDFEIENRYEGKGALLSGRTTSTDPDGNFYIPEIDPSNHVRVAYWVDLNFDDKTADLYIYGAKFLNRMPSLNLEFPDIPFTYEYDGTIKLSMANLTPEYNGLPYPSFPISALKGTLNFRTGLDLEFNCDFRGVRYKVTFAGKYRQ